MLLNAEFYYDFTDFLPHPQPFSPGVPLRRGPKLAWQVTMKFHLLNTVLSGYPLLVGQALVVMHIFKKIFDPYQLAWSSNSPRHVNNEQRHRQEAG